MSRRVAKNTVISIAGRGATMVATLVLGIAIARALGATAFGQYGAVWALIMILSVVGHMGTDSIVVRETASDPSRARDLISSAMTMRLGSALIAYVLTLTVAALMKPDRAFLGYVAIAGLTLFASWYSLFATYFEATLRIGTQTLITTGSAYLTLGLTLLVIFLKQGLSAILWMAVLANFVMLTVAYLLLSRHVRPTFGRDLAVMKSVIMASLPLAGNLFLLMFEGKLPRLILLKVNGASIVGDYVAASQITESLGILPQAFMLSVFPLMSFYRANQPARFEDIYRKSLRYMSAIILPLALLVSFYSRDILRLLYGETFVLAAPALAILAWFMFFVFISSVNFNAIIAENRQKTFFGVSLFMLVPTILLYFLLIPRYGLVGAAIAPLVQQVVFYATLLALPSMRKYGIASVGASFRPLVATACAAIFLYGLNTAFQGVVAFAVYVVVLVAIRGVEKGDHDLLRNMLRGT
jgi:O-antigen/teichoic acid export membrane protein